MVREIDAKPEACGVREARRAAQYQRTTRRTLTPTCPIAFGQMCAVPEVQGVQMGKAHDWASAAAQAAMAEWERLRGK